MRKAIDNLKKDKREKWEFFTVEYPLMDRDNFFDCLEQRQDHDLFSRFVFTDFKNGIIENYLTSSATVFFMSTRLWHYMLKESFPNTTMQSIPVLGYRPIEKFSDPEKRVVEIPCDCIAPKSPIHEIIQVDRLGLYFHDLMYHLYVESANPHRQLWIDLAFAVKPFNLELFKIIIDRDFVLYSRPDLVAKSFVGRYLNPEEMFWYSIISREVDMKDSFPLIMELLSKKQFQNRVSFSVLRECLAKESPNSRLSVKPLVDALDRQLSCAPSSASASN